MPPLSVAAVQRFLVMICVRPCRHSAVERQTSNAPPIGRVQDGRCSGREVPGDIVFGGPEGDELRLTGLSLLKETNHVLLLPGEIERIDSEGVAALVGLSISARNRGGEVKLAELSPKCSRVLHVTRIEKVFEIYETEEQALASSYPGKAAYDLKSCIALLLDPAHSVQADRHTLTTEYQTGKSLRTSRMEGFTKRSATNYGNESDDFCYLRSAIIATTISSSISENPFIESSSGLRGLRFRDCGVKAGKNPPPPDDPGNLTVNFRGAAAGWIGLPLVRQVEPLPDGSYLITAETSVQKLRWPECRWSADLLSTDNQP